jgi:hypothetical protein
MADLLIKDASPNMITRLEIEAAHRNMSFREHCLQKLAVIHRLDDFIPCKPEQSDILKPADRTKPPLPGARP